MSWDLFWAHVAAFNRGQERRQHGDRLDPETWAGRDADPWWAEQDQKRNRERGR